MCKRFVCVLLGSWSPEAGRPGIGKVEGPIPRSGVDSVGRSAPDAAAIGPAMEPASFLTSLCARRLDFCRGMSFRMLQRWRGDKRIRGAWPHGTRFPFPATPRVDGRRSSTTDTDPSFSTYSIPSNSILLPCLSPYVLPVPLGTLDPFDTHSSRFVNLRHEFSKSIDQHVCVGTDSTY
jgi:hypothetical protein